jgi:hypothetical protein
LRGLRRALTVGGALTAVAAALAFGAHRIAATDAAYTAPGGTSCVPAHLNASAVLPGTSISASPLPGAYDASASTQISLLGAPASALSGVSVAGSQSGPHPGKLEPYSQGDGASFVPATAFDPGETVTVRGRVREASHSKVFLYRFVVAQKDTGLFKASAGANVPKDYNEEQHFHSAPTLQAPVLAVTASSAQSPPGDIFAGPYTGPGPPGPEIFSPSGELIWFDPLASSQAATNLQVQQYDSKPVLTWWQGYIPPQGFGEGEEIIDDDTYRQVGRVHAGNGLKADLHDFKLNANETAVLTLFDPIDCNLSSVGGPSSSAVTDSGFQEIDLTTGLVRREWLSLDHVGLSDSYSSASGASTEWPFDYFHINTVGQLNGNTTLISARNTWALYELDTRTGQVLLRVGGKHNDVKQATGAKTAFQHDATAQANGTITVFDNGAVPKVEPQSRALVLDLNAQTKTETLLAAYAHAAPALSSGSQGNVQTLPGGDTFVGWGSEPYFSEYGSAGQLLYDAHWHGSYESYRAYRFPWSATPASPPSLAIVPGAVPSAQATVYASWNGATVVASWRVLAGPSPSRLAPVASAAKASFETAIAIPGNEAYVTVQALNAAGATIGTSAVIQG